MKINIRLEVREDENEVEVLTRKAFYSEKRLKDFGIACDEHYLVHILRQSKDYVKELNFVAELDGKIVGHIIYTIGKIVKLDESTHKVLIFGPLSVLPEYHSKGIGSALMKYSIKEAKKLGYGGIMVYGYPTYYSKFGFIDAKTFGITTKEGKNFPAFMALELILDNLKNNSGAFYESKVYDVDKATASEYDKKFM